MMKRYYCGYIIVLFLLVPLTGIMAQDDEMMKVHKLNINTRQYNEMTPVLISGGIVFCSDRRISGIVNNKTFDNDRVYNIFYAPHRDSLEWGNAAIYSDDLKSFFTRGPFCFSPDGSELYFTGDVETGKRAFKRGFENRSGIYIVEKVPGGWSDPVPFEYNDPLWNVGHPFISNDGKYLFFASDIPGGQGGSDIWMCRKEGDGWSEPENPGRIINSSSSELYPFFTMANELLFASDRPGGKGGLDLYSSRMHGSEWSAPVLMPEPINSEADDFGLIKEETGTEGYFASNRDRTDDIYKYISDLKRMSNCDSIIYDSFCYEFIEGESEKFDSIPFRYEWDFDDGTKANGVRAVHCFEEPGTYLVKLNVIDELTGEVKENEVSYLLEIKRTVQGFITSPDTCYTGEPIELDAAYTYLPGWDIAEYYWNFDDGSADTGLKTEKTYFREGIYNVQLIISSHPDQEGNFDRTCVHKYIVVEERGFD